MKNLSALKNNKYPNSLKSIALTLFFALNFFAMSAQTNTVSGIIFDKQCEPILFGNILLKNIDNQTICAVELSDVHGFFQFSNAAEGKYQIEVSYNGVPLYCTDVFEHADRSTNLPLLLVDNFTSDMIVTVTAKRKNKENYLAAASF